MRTTAEAVVAVAWIALTTLGAPATRAQAPTPPGDAPRACLDTISSAALTRVVVYLTATADDSVHGVSPTLLAGVDEVAQSASEVVRRVLGARTNVVPTGEPLLTWRQLAGGIRVVARRNGTMQWLAAPREVTALPSGDDRGAAMLGRALDSLRASGESLLWDPAAPQDSVVFSLHFVASSVSREGTVRAPTFLRSGVPTMTLAVPWTTEVATMPGTRVPRYPPLLRQMNYQGTVVLQFVVDSTGAVDQATVRDVLPRGQRAFVGSDGDAYRQFVEASRQALRSARYEPARVGGCAVPQQVQQPFTFALSGGPTTVHPP